MKMLFLDDDPARCKMVRSLIPSTTIVSRVEDCIPLLNQGWDVVSLDHDLGGEVYVDSERENTGMEVVRWIVKHQPNILYIICHSLNPIGRRRMVDALRQAEYTVLNLPFQPQNYENLGD